MRGFLELEVKGTSAKLAPTSLDVSVSVVGFLAETTVIMKFNNDGDEDIEGELVFPLEEGGTVCGYAVDINGKLVDAVIVEKV